MNTEGPPIGLVLKSIAALTGTRASTGATALRCVSKHGAAPVLRDARATGFV